jgi:hypothetical protein
MWGWRLRCTGRGDRRGIARRRAGGLRLGHAGIVEEERG